MVGQPSQLIDLLATRVALDHLPNIALFLPIFMQRSLSQDLDFNHLLAAMQSCNTISTFSILPTEIRLMIYKRMAGLKASSASDICKLSVRSLRWTDLLISMRNRFFWKPDLEVGDEDLNPDNRCDDVRNILSLQATARVCGLTPFAAFLTNTQFSDDILSHDFLIDIRFAEYSYRNDNGMLSGHCRASMPHCRGVPDAGLEIYITFVTSWLHNFLQHTQSDLLDNNDDASDPRYYHLRKPSPGHFRTHEQTQREKHYSELKSVTRTYFTQWTPAPASIFSNRRDTMATLLCT